MSDVSLPDPGSPEGDPEEPGESPAGGKASEAAGLDSQEDFVHQSVELPTWIPVVFGLILIGIAVVAIWMAGGW